MIVKCFNAFLLRKLPLAILGKLALLLLEDAAQSKQFVHPEAIHEYA